MTPSCEEYAGTVLSTTTMTTVRTSRSALMLLIARPSSALAAGSASHLLRGRSVIVVTIVKVIEPGARRDVQVGGSETAGTVREEVETPAVEGQSRALLGTCGIDGG